MWFTLTNAAFLCRLLAGSRYRREGGQGVVVFAKCKHNPHLWAIKFFVLRRHFLAEQAMYNDPILSQILPEVCPSMTDTCSTIVWLAHIQTRTIGPLFIESPQEETSVYRDTIGLWRSILGPNEILNEQLNFCRHDLTSLVYVDMMECANCEMKNQIVTVQY